MTAPHTVRQATVALLDALGMTTVFGNPGSTELPLFRDFPAHFRYVLGLQESVVIGMADGYAQATRRAALVNLHSAAGLGHGLGNLFTAFRNQTPLVVTAGQQARAILPHDPFLFAERATEFPRPYVKYAIEPARAADVPGAILRAWHIAMTPPCGPVFVSVPVDDWDRVCAPVTVTMMARQIGGDAALLDALADALAAARRPAIVVGAGVARDDAWAQTVSLAEAHNAAVFVAPMAARNGFPENHRLFQGFLPAFREAIVAALDGHDLILVLGAPVFTYHAEGAGPHVPPGAGVWQLVDDPAAASALPVGTAIVTSLRPALDALLRAPAPVRPAPPLRRIVPPAPGGRLRADQALALLAAHRPPGSVVVEEAPSHRATMQTHLPMVAPDSFYTTASGGLGHGLPAAIGVALGRPGTRVIALLGDGSSMYAIQGLWTAARLDLPISFVVLNNARYQALHSFAEMFGLGIVPGTDLGGLDFAGLAQAQGVDAVRVDTADDWDAALARSFATPRPTLIEVVLDR
ncbi:benzoylformate decarboxylase [Novosphingobium sp. FSW06-99]|uniref:benzoylformate decarboxylase n=1 Tax=Novosphingobium sp. FSW06-99 TaxID=1739113 RepID=UPI00076D8628|nr:benzoylformate decarboxylase [Novosphingobium sp. FSW06-99]KUR76443.1 benzoylformate decarboxylase [Novosphingobium sp. FSW06-99]